MKKITLQFYSAQKFQLFMQQVVQRGWDYDADRETLTVTITWDTIESWEPSVSVLAEIFELII